MNDTGGKNWAIITKIGIFSVSAGPLIAILANGLDRVAAFYFILVYITSVWLVGLLQLILHKPAPYWVNADIKTYDCFPGYAAPGTQMTVATTILLSIWSICGFGPNPKCNTKLKKIISLILITAVIWGTNYGHLFNGDVSLDQ